MYGEEEEHRTFTLSEARSLLPKLRRLLARAASEREALVDVMGDVERARDKAELGGGTVLGPEYLEHMFTFTGIVQEIESLGVQIKDFRTGLVDFPYDHDGRIVYLCWKLDEDEIGWWHEVDSGFAGRQPLTADFS